MESTSPRYRREDHTFSYQNGDFSHPVTYKAIDSNTSLSISDCFVKCWNDCLCVGFINGCTNGTGCTFWRGRNGFTNNPLKNPTWMYVIRSPNSPGKVPKIIGMIIMLVMGTSIPLVFLRLGLLWFLSKDLVVSDINKLSISNVQPKSPKFFAHISMMYAFTISHFGSATCYTRSMIW